MFIISQVLGIIAVTILIISIQFKAKKNIIILIALSNIIFALSFIFLKAYSGALISFILAIQAIITYLYDIKKKKIPSKLIPLYFLISILAGFITYKTYIDILPILCSILYVFTIIQTKEKYIRILSLLSILVWIIYMFFTRAYTTMILEIFLLMSTVIAIIKYDILKNQKIKEDNINE